MRKTTILLALAALAATAGMSAAEGNMARELTIVSWGGEYSRSQLRAYHDPYSVLNGVEIRRNENSADAVPMLRAMKKAGDITWDVVDVVAADAKRLCDEGLAMKINADKHLAPSRDGKPASEDFGDLLVNDCFIPQVLYSTTFGYRTDMVGANPPDDICDVFDLVAYPGKRALEKRPVNNMEWALLCDGVSKDDIYDVLATSAGQDRAIKKLDTIKNSVVWWSNGADTPRMLFDGDVVMGSTYNGRLFNLIEAQKQPVAMLWDAQVADLDGWIIPAGLPQERRDRALHYVRFATGTEKLADLAKYISYRPARLSAIPLVGRHADLGIDMGPHLPTFPANAKNTLRRDHEFWAKYRDEIDAKFLAWLEQ